MRGARMHHVEWARQRCSLIKNRKRISLTMFRPLQLFIGLRYTRAKRRNHFISFISAVSMLGIDVGDKVTVYTSEINVTPIGGVARFKRFDVVGIFSVGFAEYDTGVAVVHMDDAEKLFQTDGPSGIRLKLDDMLRAWPITRVLAERLPQAYRITTWEQGHANFFSAVKMEKLVMFIILSLIVAVAAFNLVSTLIMLVTDKQADIAILRTLGISPNSVMGIFMVQGVIVGTFGILLGVFG